MYENYLAHYGVLGQKWGIRRYQPYSVRGRKSGEGGKEVGEAKKISRDKLFSPSVKDGKDKPNISPAEKTFKETGKIVENTGKIVKVSQKVRSKNKLKESKSLSDAELRKRIERLELEKRYDSLSEEDVSKGKVTAQDILTVVGSIAAIGASTAAIVSTIHELKG